MGTKQAHTICCDAKDCSNTTEIVITTPLDDSMELVKAVCANHWIFQLPGNLFCSEKCQNAFNDELELEIERLVEESDTPGVLHVGL